ncbi:ABC transporter permease [Microvirga mediterraneensis]|uniref:ABC transporter permease n=1 Tax=Microvirga mediterraneensis TaxID=2754695 RepID=A0A838BJT5_9HYPH|nr:ABC transporter permease [Microvirga mediterraneensis]MBA1155807.1 ABC transporter permease [Microvirga mediterraneensis]
MTAPGPATARGGGALRRIAALIRKETYQLLRDPSSIAIGIVMPLLMLVLFGYGLNLDVKNVPMALVMEDTSADARGVASGFELSEYFDTVTVKTMAEAERLLLAGTVDAIVRVPFDFARRVELGSAEIQVIVHGADANTARISLGYAQGAVATWLAREAARGRMLAQASVSIENRLWFNEANESTYFLVPGLIVLVMTLIGALLTALVVAREWERGTFEALFVTPVRSVEVLLGKTIPYFVLGMIGLALSVLGSLILFGVPLRGSVLVLAGVSILYLLVALGIGLVISSATKSQFLASQISMVATFLPAMMLSGFMFDLRSMPWVIQLVTYVFPARYFVSLLQTLFLAGNVWSVIVPNAAVLAAMAALLLTLAVRLTRKRIG